VIILLKNILYLFALLLITSTSLGAKDLYIQVTSIHKSNLFNTVYDLNELGYKAYTDKKNDWYKVYVGPFNSTKKAEQSLKLIQKNISKNAYIINKSGDIPKLNETKKSDDKKSKPNNILKSVDNFGIGLESYYYNNKFEKDGAYSFSLEGYKHGISLMGTKTLGNFIYLLGDIHYTFADITFKDASGYEKSVPETMYETRAVLGAEFIKVNHLLSPFIGIGYRTLFNDFKNVDGSTHESKYIYVPVGITHRYALGSKARLSTSLEYDYFISGEVKNATATYKQNDTYGFRVKSAYEKRDLYIGLFLVYMDAAKSDSIYNASSGYTNWIKKNSTLELGFEIKYFWN